MNDLTIVSPSEAERKMEENKKRMQEVKEELQRQKIVDDILACYGFTRQQLGTTNIMDLLTEAADYRKGREDLCQYSLLQFMLTVSDVRRGVTTDAPRSTETSSGVSREVSAPDRDEPVITKRWA